VTQPGNGNIGQLNNNETRAVRASKPLHVTAAVTCEISSPAAR
jgi:hypothetical protein